MPENNGDRLILAQAAVCDATLLSTNNLRTIYHKAANEWFRKTIGTNHQVAHTPDETITALSKGNLTTQYHWTLTYGERWTSEKLQRDENAMRTIYEESLDRAKGAGFIEIADTARWTYENEDEGGFIQSLVTALQARGRESALAAEQRRQRTIHKATATAGSAS